MIVKDLIKILLNMPMEHEVELCINDGMEAKYVNLDNIYNDENKNDFIVNKTVVLRGFVRDEEGNIKDS